MHQRPQRGPLRLSPLAQTYAQDDRWWSAEEGRQYGNQLGSQDDQLPLIVRNRLRG